MAGVETYSDTACLCCINNYEWECGQRINGKRLRERTNLPGRNLLFSDLLYLELRQERSL